MGTAGDATSAHSGRWAFREIVGSLAADTGSGRDDARPAGAERASHECRNAHPEVIVPSVRFSSGSFGNGDLARGDLCCVLVELVGDVVDESTRLRVTNTVRCDVEDLDATGERAVVELRSEFGITTDAVIQAAKDSLASVQG